MKELRWYDDGGHGWLRVPIGTCEGLAISGYSYRGKTVAYLEEDVDAPLWLRAHPEVSVAGIPVTYQDRESHVRRMPSFHYVWPTPGDRASLVGCGKEWAGACGTVVKVGRDWVRMRMDSGGDVNAALQCVEVER